MKRQLPIVDIAGTPFYVDVLQDELRQQDDSDNRIPFHVFDQIEEGYTFLYDKERKNVPEGRKRLTRMEPHFIWITLPALMELDPEGIAIKYHIPLDILCPGSISEGQFEEDDDDEEFY